MELTRRHALQGLAAGTVAGGVGIATAGSAAAADPTLRPGDRGTSVKNLQIYLARLGYWLGSADGVYGLLTTQAVYAIQGAGGLTRDGICGPMTWSKVRGGVRPSVRSRSGKCIEIDKARGLLKYVYDGRLHLTLHTSTGASSTPTPTGSFRVFRQVSGWDSGPLGRLYAPKYFYNGYAIHGYTSIPGYPASHGCARVSISAMNLFWGSSYPIQIGTAVSVY